jgi:hypothetical protein
MWQKRTNDPEQHFTTVDCRIAKELFDYLVGVAEQRYWKCKAECFRCLEIDNHPDFRGLNDR